MLDSEPDPTLTAESCCQLINAYLGDPEHVEWDEVQKALDTALKRVAIFQIRFPRFNSLFLRMS